MDESEKRKERLKAMRLEAAQSEVPNNVATPSVPGHLSNPLSETSSTAAVQEDFCSTPRFDYYTDPMAAFSANKKRGKADNQSTQNYFTPPTTSGWPVARVSPSHPGPRNYDMNPPVRHMQSQYSLDQRMYHQQGPHSNFAAHRSPISRSPSHMHHGNSDAWNGSQAFGNYYSSASDGSPGGMFGTPPMHPGTSPRFWNPSNASRYSNSPTPGFSPADIPYGRGRPQQFGNYPLPSPGHGGNLGLSSGRGRGRGYGGSITHGIGRSGGRGLGFHGHSSASNRTMGPESFYDESMLEDPWQHLKPVLWRRREAGMDSLSNPDSSNSWFPKSISAKKVKVSEASNKFNSQLSLAEYLAASFNKAVEDTQNE
ncbi:hypothetical protein POUND7_018048 [Theobroma cacao]